MKSIIVISPHYLDAVYEESQKYDFRLFGYGTFACAKQGLLKVNCSDILGFAFVGTHLPISRSKEFKHMLEFFHMCDLLNADKKFVIVTDEDSSPWTKIFKKYKNLRFFGCSGYDFMSDIIINKNVFGSILLDSMEPYEFGNKKQDVISWHTPHLSYVPLFPDTQIQCTAPIEFLGTMERTLSNDAIYQRFKTEGAYLQSFRLYYIALTLKNSDEIQRSLSEIEQILDRQDDTGSFCSLYALKNYMEEIADGRVSKSIPDWPGST